MSRPVETDIVILGGGCAALQLAMAYSQSKKTLSYRILILEKRKQYSNDRIWSFWLDSTQPFVHQDLLASQYTQWRFSKKPENTIYTDKVRDGKNRADNNQVIHRGGKFRYSSIRAEDFYAKALRLIENDTRIDLRLNHAITGADITQAGEFFLIQLADSVVKARHVIDTRFSPWDYRAYPAKLYQVFYGVEVELPAHITAGLGANENTSWQNTAGLMDQLYYSPESNQEGLHFIYQLPLDQRRCFIEATVFSPQPLPPETLKPQLNAFLKENYNIDIAACSYHEQASLPMGLSQLSRPLQPPRSLQSPQPSQQRFLPDFVKDPRYKNYTAIGAASGALRASSGYSFLRLSRWVQTCITRLEHGNLAFDYTFDSPFSKFLDHVFLEALLADMTAGPDVFLTLAQKMPPDAFARFMNSQASLGDTLQLLSAVSKPFILKGLFSSFSSRPPNSKMMTQCQ
ncbi:MAG: lycopene cyclase family protein [Cyanobacteria bacterium P01_H01_bin.74]